MRKTSYGSFSSRAPFGIYPAILTVALCLIAAGVARAQSATASISADVHPYAVAVNALTNQIYVANIGSNDVTVINGATNIPMNIPVGINPGGVAMTQPTAVAINPTTNLIYVANQGTAAKQFADGGVTVINGITNQVTATITAGKSPVAVAVNPLTNKVYVANYGNGLSTVTIYNANTNAATNVAVGSSPTAVAINTATNQVYVANKGSNTISIIDGASDSVTATISTSPAVLPIAVVVNPTLNHVYVATTLSNSAVNPSVSVIDPVQKKVLKTVTVGNNPSGLAFNAVTNTVYVANQGDGTVTVIQDGATIGSNVLVPVGNSPTAVAVNAATNQIYVTNQGSNSLTVIDGATNAVSAAVPVGTGPGAVALNPVTNKIYVANAGNDVTVVDGATNSTNVDVTGTLPIAVAVNPVTHKAYVANRGNSTLTVIDEVTNAASTVPVGVLPSAIAVNSVTNKIYVANYGSYSVTAIDGVTNVPTTIHGVGPDPISIAINTANNVIYVANQGTSLKNWVDSSVSVIDGATNVVQNVPLGADLFIGGPLQLVSIAVDPTVVPGGNGQVYVVNEGTAAAAYADGGLYMMNVLDVTTGQYSITPWYPQGPVQPVRPIAVTVNPSDNHVFVANYGSNSVDVYDQYGDYLPPNGITTGTNPYAIAINSATNYAYVPNYGSHNVTAISDNLDPVYGTNLFPTTTIEAGSNPYGVAVDPVTNKIYVTNYSGNNTTVIDGVSGSTTTVLTRVRPTGVAVDPTTGKVYVANNGSNNVTVITEATSTNPAIPLTIQAQGTADSGTSANMAIFATSNPTPAFAAVVNSGFSPNTVAPTALYYQVDSTAGNWMTATAAGSPGSNPAGYTLSLRPVLPGLHTLYLYSAFGAEGTSSSAGNGNVSSPQLSRLQAYPFASINPPTQITIQANANPQSLGLPVTFTACATPLGPVAGVWGTVTFLDGNVELGQVTIDPLNPNLTTCPTGGLQGVYTTNRLTQGSHTITAVYSGNTVLSSSSASLTEEVDLNLTLSMALPTNGAPVYGQLVKVAAKVALAGAVTFTVNGQAQTPVNVVGGSAFLTLPLTGQPRLAAGSYTVEASFAGTAGQNLTATPYMFTVSPAPLTVTPISTYRFYGAANPVLHGTVVGVLSGDGITATFTPPPDVTPTSPANYSPGYPINVQLNDPNNKLSNYAVTIAPGYLAVNPLGLTLVGLSEVRPYGTADNFKFSLIGALPADLPGLMAGVTGSAPSVALNSPVGSYPKAITPQWNKNSDNYFINSTVPGSVTITKAQLTVSADPNQTRLYGAADPVWTATVTGALAADGITGYGTSTDTISSIVGSYLITPHVNDPNNRLSNYTVIPKYAYFTITKAPLTVTAGSLTSAVGQPLPTLTGTNRGRPSERQHRRHVQYNGDDIESGRNLYDCSKGEHQLEAVELQRDAGQRHPNPTITTLGRAITLGLS